MLICSFFFQAEDGIRDTSVTGVQTCALPIYWFTRASLNFIRDEREHPFFLYLAHITPHANNERQRESKDGLEVPSDAPYTKERSEERRVGKECRSRLGTEH